MKTNIFGLNGLVLLHDSVWGDGVCHVYLSVGAHGEVLVEKARGQVRRKSQAQLRTVRYE